MKTPKALSCQSKKDTELKQKTQGISEFPEWVLLFSPHQRREWELEEQEQQEEERE